MCQGSGRAPESWGLKDLGKMGLDAKIQKEKEGEEMKEVVLMMTMHDIC